MSAESVPPDDDEGGFVTVELALDTERWDSEIGWTNTVLGILSAEHPHAE